MADLIIAPVRVTDHGPADHGPADHRPADREVWVAFDAADLEVTALDAVDLTRPLAKIAADHVVVPADRVLTGLDRTAVTSLTAILFGAEACGLAGWAVQHRRRIRQDQASVRPADRAVPGRQAPVRPDADPGRAGASHGLGRLADRPGRRPRLLRQRRRRRGPGRGGRCHQRLHPDSRRHRLHLGTRRSPVLPPGAHAPLAARFLHQLADPGGPARPGQRHQAAHDRAARRRRRIPGRRPRRTSRDQRRHRPASAPKGWPPAAG